MFSPGTVYVKAVEPVPKGRPPKKLPSIAEQTKWATGFYKFPDEWKSFGVETEYFNCTLLGRANGVNTLIARHRVIPLGTVGANTLKAWTLVGNEPVKAWSINIPRVHFKENFEDPRVTWVGGQILLSWCNFKWNSFAHQCVGWLNERQTVGKVFHPVVGKNGPRLMANTGHEKNWLWFEHDGIVRLLYTANPHTIYDTFNFVIGTKHESPGVLWNYGEVRGGTPPIRVGDEYFTFFHSRTKWIPPKCRYHMGCYAFEAKPPFKVTRCTTKPLLSGSELDRRNLGAPLVVFPEGSKFVDGKWLVVGGSNDCQCFWQYIPHEELMDKTKPI
ncbi:MAG: hypothetical protein HW407_1056 [Bacteroidetes bacterium]|nr:hypothetical protein [Bacteroidota bacterium]